MRAQILCNSNLPSLQKVYSRPQRYISDTNIGPGEHSARGASRGGSCGSRGSRNVCGGQDSK